VDNRWRIEHHVALPSTMDRARDLAEAGAPAGTVVVADFQTAGRGTHGRVWLAPPGSCLMFTLVARPALTPAELEHLPLRVSESLARALRDCLGVPCLVKEPNDILLAGRKLCGVLCTSHIVGEDVRWVLSGIGLNTHMTREQLPLATATSLATEGVVVPPHQELLPALLESLVWLLGDTGCAISR
jgi:BirA family transcriptional regulator, biotin operon repressor / biotin---[acetyl-CoA-carboxylase] ligase